MRMRLKILSKSLSLANHPDQDHHLIQDLERLLTHTAAAKMIMITTAKAAILYLQPDLVLVLVLIPAQDHLIPALGQTLQEDLADTLETDLTLDLLLTPALALHHTVLVAIVHILGRLTRLARALVPIPALAPLAIALTRHLLKDVVESDLIVETTAAVAVLPMEKLSLIISRPTFAKIIFVKFLAATGALSLFGFQDLAKKSRCSRNWKVIRVM